MRQRAAQQCRVEECTLSSALCPLLSALCSLLSAAPCICVHYLVSWLLCCLRHRPATVGLSHSTSQAQSTTLWPSLLCDQPRHPPLSLSSPLTALHSPLDAIRGPIALPPRLLRSARVSSGVSVY